MAALDTPTAPRRLAAYGLLLAAFVLLGPAVARPQGPDADGVYYRRETTWNIPFERVNASWIKRVELFVSRDQGRDWRLVAPANTNGTFPPFTATEDGMYWFAARAIDFQEQPHPKLLSELKEQRKIVLDRKPPVVSLRQIPDRRPNVVTVEWDVRDENIDLRRFAIDFRVQGRDWKQEPEAVPHVTGMQSWGQVQPGVPMQVRLRVFDKAGNQGEAILPVGLTADGRPMESTSGPFGGGATGATGGPIEPRYVNNRQVTFTYKLENNPLSGVRVFDLWFTKNRGQTWAKAPKPEGSQGIGVIPSAPGAPVVESRKLLFDAETQGLYGFRIVARNGVDIGNDDPKPGDQPDHWVVVDTDLPVVKLNAQRGERYEVRNVRIDWTASDVNLADRPVMLQYAEVKDSTTAPAETDWKTIEGHEGPLDKSGSFVWTIGPKGPFRFLIRAKATDKAGNTKVDQTPEPLLVDLEPPKIVIESIGAGGGGK